MGREHRFAALDDEQRQIERLLQARNRVADRGLAPVEGGGRLRETAVIDDRSQDRPLLQ